MRISANIEARDGYFDEKCAVRIPDPENKNGPRFWEPLYLLVGPHGLEPWTKGL